MERWREILLVVIILILLFLFSRKGAAETTTVSSKLLDPLTGLPIGAGGIRFSSVGEAILPPNITNNLNTADTISYAKNPTIPLCPEGYAPVIDPDTSQIYCVLPSQLAVAQETRIS